MSLRKLKKAQGATEYAIFIAAVLAGLLALQVYYSRSVKGNMKGRADSIGEQFDNKGGEYVRESRSASASRSFSNMNLTGTGYDEYNDRQSLNVMATKEEADNIKGDWLDVFGKSKVRNHYDSGAVSSTEYVDANDFGTVPTDGADFGTHGYASMGAIEGGSESVFSDGRIYRNRQECNDAGETSEFCNQFAP